MQNRLVQFLVIYLLSMICGMAPIQAQVENNTPIVKIIQPKTSKPLKWNTLIPYSITVNDVEDGNSAYEEITDWEVLLIAKYLKDSSLVKDYLARIKLDLVPLFAMSKSTCLTCHAASSKLIGPSFDLIAKRYRENDRAKTYLTEKIISGGTGIWGEVKMPPNPDLNKAEVALIVDWILKQADNPTPFYVGMEGAIRAQKAQTNSDIGVYVLTAAYKDHGLTSAPKNQKLGLQTITLKIR